MNQRWILPAFTAHCAELRIRIAKQSAALVSDCDRMKPGSEHNPDVTEFGYAAYYLTLRAAIAGVDAERVPSACEAVSSFRRLLEIVTDTPISADSLGDLRVYPKSIASLEFIQWCGERLQWLDERQPTLPTAWFEDGSRRFFELIAWIATYPTPGLPLEVWHGQAAPEAVQNLSREELAAVFSAVAKIHDSRAAFLRSLIPDERWKTSGTCDTVDAPAELLESLSFQLGVSTESLRNNRSFLSLQALAATTNELYSTPSTSTGAL